MVENRPGAGGVLGVDAIAKAAPDGYTIGLAGVGALGVDIGEPVKRPYDPAKDLVLISRAAGSPFILVATPELKASSLGDVIKLAKAEPNRMSIGHGGNGTAMQLTALTFVSMADVKINVVPYRGTAPAVADAIAGHVQLAIADPPPSMGAISEGKLKAIAVSSKQRFPMFPDVQTFDEMGLKGFEITGCSGRSRMHEPSLSQRRPLFGCLCGTFSPSSRQIRSMRLTFTTHPASRSMAAIRR